MARRQVGFAVLGCGMIGEFHAQSIRQVPGARLVAVADSDSTRAQTIATQHGCKWYDSLEELLADPAVEVVNICTPTGLHAEQGMAVAQAGRHVLIEKPLDRSLAKVNRLISTCHRQGVKLGCIFQYRFTEGPRRIKQAVEHGDFGRLISGSAEVMWNRSQEYYNSSSWRGTLALDGGCLWNQAVHYIDLLCWIMGRPKKVLAAHLATTVREIEAEDVGFAQLLFRSGAVGSIRATTAVAPGLPARLEICGTHGCATLTNGVITHFATTGDKGARTPEGHVDSGAAGDAKALKAAGHIAQIEDFVEAVLLDRTPLVDGIEGRCAVKLLTEIYRLAGVRPCDA